MNPLDAALEGFEKRANPPQPGGIGRHMGQALAAGLGAAAAGGVVAGGGIAAQKIWDAITKGRDFRQMMESPYNQDLHSHIQERPKEFHQAFSSLRMVAPEFTKEPMIAGTYMRRMMTFDPSTAGGVLVEAISHDGARNESPFMEAVTRGGTEGARGGFLESMKSDANEVSQMRQHENQMSLEEAKQRMMGQSGHNLENHKHELGKQMEQYKQSLRPKAPGGQGAPQNP